ncbi:MAG: VWA domain-containing protein [Kiritimatiellia bacterium]
MTFQETVEAGDGLRSITLPTPVTHVSRAKVGRLSVEISATEKEPLRTIFSPSHDVKVTRDSGQGRSALEMRERGRQRGPAPVLGGRRRRPGPPRPGQPAGKGEDGFFMLFGNPTGSAMVEKPAPREVLFVLDTSGSMRGEKIEQARAAMEYCTGRLNTDINFNLITFGTQVTPFKDSPVAASAANVAAARVFMEAVAEGGTNISGALAAALAGEATPDAPPRHLPHRRRPDRRRNSARQDHRGGQSAEPLRHAGLRLRGRRRCERAPAGRSLRRKPRAAASICAAARPSTTRWQRCTTVWPIRS